ncbi:MAG: dihydrolipoamide acetyltransferase family protein, partial [Pseudomonadota bacterium]
AFRQVLASPSLRKRAREEGINLAYVPGSGPKGRISHQDFDAFLTSGLTAGSTTGLATGGDLAVQAPLPLNTTREIKLSGMRRVIARKMLASKRNIPHYSYIEEVDVTELESLRAHLNTERETHQPKLTLLPFLALALVKVLPRFPHCNARFDDEAEVLTEFDAVHLGVATMTDAGLMVPVLTHCEVMDVWQVAAEVARLSDLARDGKASPQQLSGATITISSLGAIGGIATTPIINAPETTIVGVNKMQERPVVRKGEIVVRTMMNLSASFDHRIVDGYDGAQLVQSLKSKLENPGAIFV